jgi:hypothetical protein
VIQLQKRKLGFLFIFVIIKRIFNLNFIKIKNYRVPTTSPEKVITKKRIPETIIPEPWPERAEPSIIHLVVKQDDS